MSNQIKLILPTQIILPRKKTKDKIIKLNFNAVKNLHFQVYNQTKIKFKELLIQNNPIPKEPFNPQNALVVFTHYHGSRHIPDLDNLSFITKFTFDALMPNFICNDSIKEIASIRHDFGGFDLENPRVEMCMTW